MSRIYVTEEDSGRRFLLRLECDHNGCNAKITPRPDIAESGWTKVGCDIQEWGGRFEYDYCPDHESTGVDQHAYFKAYLATRPARFGPRS